MTHLFVCREYPPAAYPPGGIGTYVRYMTDLLARSGETVHVIAHRWGGAPRVREETLDGRLIVHRVALDDPSTDTWSSAEAKRRPLVPRGLLASTFPAQAFAWQAALLAERLVDTEGIDIIEAQEWEAPLYYFQLRRALNLGPAAQPPCVIHIHSPSERIFAANGWDTTVTDYLPGASLEAYSIVAADAVLCPSRFVAEETIARYNVDPSRVTVIPYPLGDVPHIDRTTRAWSDGSICHVGRLEPRKGVLEWGEAVAMAAADTRPFLMEFIGGDVPLHVTGGPTVGRTLRAAIPRHVQRQFRFHGSRDRADVFTMLSHAWAAVVPSRWDNFPYSCIESMCTGLPIIASPNGGMRELVEDGVSGWIAADATPAGLAAALKRALATPASERERMGRAAEQTVRRACDNGSVVQRHLDAKARLKRESGARSSRGARHLFGSASAPPAPAGDAKIATVTTGRRGAGIVVTGANNAQALAACLAAIRSQTARPVTVWVACDDDSLQVEDGDGLQIHVVRRNSRPIGEVEIDAVRQLCQNCELPLGVALLDAGVRLDSEGLASCLTLLAAHDGVGVVSSWVHHASARDIIQIPPSLATPYLWPDGRTAPFVVVRAEACEGALTRLREAGGTAGVCEAVLRAGWDAVTYPSVLASTTASADDSHDGPALAKYSAMARAIQRLHTPLLQWLLSCPAEERRALIREGLMNPARSVRRLIARTRQARRQSPSSDAQRPGDADV